jgi:hypothetical protein
LGYARAMVRWLTVFVLIAGCKGRAERPAGAAPVPVADAALSLGSPCGALECMQFDSPDDALRDALRGDVRVLSIGEAHAQKGSKVASSAKRFTLELLPTLAGRASDLVVELMVPPTGCAARVDQVKETHKAVTAHQAAEDQSEYVAMGEAARKLGIVPDLLRPTCADLDAIQDAGEDAIDLSLRTIERLTARKVKDLLDRDARSPADHDKIVLTYGGAVHNDRAPRPERRAWSFAPELDEYTGGRLVEVDLYVPEFIVDSEAWRSLPFYAHYDAARLGSRVTRFRVRERSYVIVLARASAGAE